MKDNTVNVQDVDIYLDNINIYADSDKLSRVFNNLIKNAINYSKENTDLDINVKKRNILNKVYHQITKTIRMKFLIAFKI